MGKDIFSQPTGIVINIVSDNVSENFIDHDEGIIINHGSGLILPTI